MERIQETIHCVCDFTIVFTFFHFTHPLALLYITFLMKKLRSRSRGPRRRGPIYYGTNSTMGNPVLPAAEKSLLRGAFRFPEDFVYVLATHFCWPAGKISKMVGLLLLYWSSVCTCLLNLLCVFFCPIL